MRENQPKRPELTDAQKEAAIKDCNVHRIVALEIENFKKVRVLRLDKLGHIVEFTGKNGQGKTSVLDAIWFGLKGKAALPAKALRNGAERMMVKLDFGSFTITRTLGRNSAVPSIHIDMAKGKVQWDSPQAMLDKIIGELTFDPLEFIRLDAKAQAELLRRTVVLGVDFETLNKANAADYSDRTVANSAVRQLQARINGIEVLDGLPKQKLDEAAILAKLEQAGELNRQAQEIFKAKQELGAKVGLAGKAVDDNTAFVKAQENKIAEIELQLKLAKQALQAALTDHKRLVKEQEQALKVYEAAPAGDLVDVQALTVQLQAAQRTNRAIDQREAWQKLKDELKTAEDHALALSDRMAAREEQKRVALASAKIPVEGIALGETHVTYNGLPLENLGEGEAIRISTRIGMALNPMLRVMRIPHGEALDDDGMKLLAGMAEEFDYQIWISRVDSSGKFGIVMEDGAMVARHDEGE